MKRIALFAFLGSLVVFAAQPSFCDSQGSGVKFCFYEKMSDFAPIYQPGDAGVGTFVSPPTMDIKAGGAGGFLDQKGGFGVYTDYGLPANYQLYFDGGNQSNWGFPTETRRPSPMLPGTYSTGLVSYAAQRAEGNLQAYARRLGQLEAWASKLDAGLSSFREVSMHPAVEALEKTGIEDAVRQLRDWAADRELVPTNTEEKESIRNQVTRTARGISPKIEASIEGTRKAGSAPSFWRTSEDLWRAAQRSDLPTEDAEAIQEWYRNHFRPSGLIGTAILGKEAGQLSEKLSEGLKTPLGNWDGQLVRAGLNKSLGAYASAPDLDRKGEALGAMSLLMGADAAFTDGKQEQALSLVNYAAVLTDLALGFVPVVGAVNDAVQIVHGMATGRDYAGQEMSQSDYALRGLGIMLTIVPVGAVVKYGGKVLSPLFDSGARAIRGLGLGERYAKIFGRDHKMVVTVTEAVGQLADEASDINKELEIATRKDTSFVHVRQLHNEHQFANILEKQMGLEVSLSISLLESYKLPGPAFEKGLLLHHFWKHVMDEDFLSKRGIVDFKSYILSAQNLLKGGRGVEVFTQTHDGAMVYFRKATGELGIELNGTIKTYFVPREALEYVAERVADGRYVPK